MTLIEFLVVIVIVILLAYLLLPVLVSGGPSKIGKAFTEMQGLETAIKQYKATYGYFPVSPNALASGSSDFTFGTFNTSGSAIGVTNPSGYQANNSEVMAVLMDMTHFHDGLPTVNAGHSRNPQQIVFFNAKMVPDAKSHGLGLDGVLRDPWGNPYIITIDSNMDHECRDAFYKLANVSEKDPDANGLNGLLRPTPPPYSSQTKDSFHANATVMIWSLGPDGKADRSQKADAGVNKDNILNWK
ncbi:MAG: hypothetical protein JWQ71_2784 [Pedosphaera sp.]|nr:hypothetical protein [Pedosphaera sp.]